MQLLVRDLAKASSGFSASTEQTALTRVQIWTGTLQRKLLRALTDYGGLGVAEHATPKLAALLPALGQESARKLASYSRLEHWRTLSTGRRILRVELGLIQACAVPIAKLHAPRVVVQLMQRLGHGMPSELAQARRAL